MTKGVCDSLTLNNMWNKGTTMNNKVHLIDNLEHMRTLPDNHYELAIVDPPYGISIISSGTRFKEKYKLKDWDNKTPTEEYFNEIYRISKNQIIWGANYFNMKPTRCFLIWDKQQPESVSFASCEYAWTSFDKSAKTFYLRPQGADKDGRIHPTQKPIALYKWLLKNYAKPNDKIFDSHVGSGSIRIACHDMGFDFTGCEIDKDYWNDQEARFKKHTQQGDLFSGSELQESIYK